MATSRGTRTSVDRRRILGLTRGAEVLPQERGRRVRRRRLTTAAQVFQEAGRRWAALRPATSGCRVAAGTRPAVSRR